MLGFYIVILVGGGWIFLWARHIYICHKLNRYMTEHYKKEWEDMKGIVEWYERGWGPYYSKSVHDFIWKSEQDFGDENVKILKQKIRRIIWEVLSYILIVICSFAGVILYDIYRQ